MRSGDWVRAHCSSLHVAAAAAACSGDWAVFCLLQKTEEIYSVQIPIRWLFASVEWV